MRVPVWPAPLGLLIVAMSLAPWAGCGSGAGVAEVGEGGDEEVQGDAAEAVLPPNGEPCAALFGLPNEKTGLPEGACAPACDCEGRRFVPPVYDEAAMAALEAMVLDDPFEAPAEDPYAHPEAWSAAPEGAVCGVIVEAGEPMRYRLVSYASRAEALDAGATPSHEGACGLCSPLVDLVVYMRHPDLTDPVRQCGLQGMSEGEAAQMACLAALGFDEPCARIWYWNTKHTQKACALPCLAALDEPYHLADGALNECLACDERESGPVFKAVAGRNRRNTGLPSSMCRPCAEVEPFVHVYR